MRKLWWGVPMVAVAMTVPMQAQDAVGSWQGTLHAGKDLRCVLQVSKAEGGLKGKFFSLDQGGGGIATSAVTTQGGVLAFTIPALDAKFEGKLGADGKTATGNWTQGGHPLPLVLSHVTGDAAWAIPTAPVRMESMPANADPSFEVATIKPSEPDRPGKMLTIQGRRMVTRNLSLDELISFAYEVHAKQIVGGPAWASTDKFDIEAQPDLPGAPSDRQVKSMIRKLLADRFKLSFHEEKRELAVYALERGKAGPKLTASEADPNGLPGLFFSGPGKLHARNANMADFSQLLQSTVLDRPVVDQTGLKDRFDFALTWTPDESQFGGRMRPTPTQPEAADAPPDLYTAVQEQLGLKLEAMKAPAKVLVIDRMEKASEN